MLIGIIGAPNKGKSRFFAALTQIEVQVADYPFTTIDPNKGVALLQIPCAHVALGLKKCDARGGHCKNGMREIPIQLLDVAGLVPDAHKGKGMGNQFLDDLRTADGFVQIIDLSGRTDLEGKQAANFSVEEEIGFLGKEMEEWILSILQNNISKFKTKGIGQMEEALSGLGYSPKVLVRGAKEAGMNLERIEGSEKELRALAKFLQKEGKPRIVAANKADISGARERLGKLRMDGKNMGGEDAGRIGQEGKGDGGANSFFELDGMEIMPCSAEYEYLLEKAARGGIIKYAQGADGFEIVGNANEKQKEALARIEKFLKENKGSGVWKILHKMVFEKLGMIVVYPVEDETHYCDRKGQILLDAILLPKGSTVHELALKVHTDLADKFIGAIDARTKRKISKEQELKDGDIIKIIAGR